jgi:DNA repair exonuclease SbcCD ATPase subunit
VGKSRLVEAMRFALFESSSGKSQHKKALTTWGSTEKPSVTLEFELAGARWQLQKTFLGTGYNTTLRSAGESLEDAEAEDRLAELIGVGQGGRKAVEAADLGIWSLLWVEQGESRDAPAHNAVSQARLQDHLNREIGEVAAGELGQDVLRRAEAARLEYFTAARDAEKSPLTEPRARAEDLKQRLQEAVARRDAVAADADALDEKRAAERDLVARVADARTRLDEMEKLDRNAREMGSRLELYDAELQTLEGERDRCRERLESARNLDGDIVALVQRVEAASAELASTYNVVRVRSRWYPSGNSMMVRIICSTGDNIS